MNFLSALFGVFLILIGLTIVVLTTIFLKVNRVKNSITGIFFILIGIAIVWLSLLGSVTFSINLGIPNKLFGILLVCFVMSLFILRGILDIRAGSKKLKDETISSLQFSRSRFQVIVGIIFITFFAGLMLLAISQLAR